MVNQNKFLGCKGQAALTDSLFFLAIVAAITAMLFFYMTSYGQRMNNQLDSFYTRDFAADSLKVITYVNTIRDGTELQKHIDGAYCSGGCPVPEFDYLLALMKEDYSDNQEFTPQTTNAIALTLNSVLKPFDDSVDYAFYLLSEGEDDFLFLLLAVHEGEEDTLIDAEKKIYENGYVERVYYTCNPQNQDVLVKHVTPFVGEVNQSKGKVSFVDPKVTDSSGRPFIIGLDVWISKDLPVIKDLGPQSTFAGQDFNCIKIFACNEDGCK